MNIFTFRITLAVIGLVGLVILLIAANIFKSSTTGTLACGGAITLAVSGLYALLKTLGQH
jgi:uncharacterized membrane protein